MHRADDKPRDAGFALTTAGSAGLKDAKIAALRLRPESLPAAHAVCRLSALPSFQTAVRGFRVPDANCAKKSAGFALVPDLLGRFRLLQYEGVAAGRRRYAMNEPFAARREKLRRAMRARGLDVLLISRAANRFYLSGFELHDPQCNESAGRLAITADGRDWLATDARYLDAAAPSLGHGTHLYLRRERSQGSARPFAALRQPRRSGGRRRQPGLCP